MAVYQIIKSHGKVIDWIRNHKTDILTYGGIGLMTASTVVACVGTKNVIEHKEEINAEPNAAKRVWKKGRYFVLATGFWVGGVCSIHKSHGILKAENAALSNTIVSMAAGTMAYRNRWKDKVGSEEEEKIFLDEKTEEITDENGKKKKVKTTNIDQTISTDVYFDRWCSWAADESGDMDYDAKVIDNVMCVLNNDLRGNPERYVLLQKAYDLLSIFMINDCGQCVDYRTVAGQISGWIYDKENPNGDNSVVLKRVKTHRRLDDGRIVPTWRISFNIDGNIMKPLRERGWIK